MSKEITLYYKNTGIYSYPWAITNLPNDYSGSFGFIVVSANEFNIIKEWIKNKSLAILYTKTHRTDLNYLAKLFLTYDKVYLKKLKKSK